MTLRGTVSGKGGRGVGGRPELGEWVGNGGLDKGRSGSKGLWGNGPTPGEGCGSGAAFLVGDGAWVCWWKQEREAVL